MSLRVMTHNEQFKTSLEKALKQAYFKINDNETPDLAIIFEADNNITAVAKELNCPLFEITKDDIPLRFGSLIDKIKHHLKMIKTQDKETEIHIGDMILNLHDALFIKPDQKPVTLTEKEMMILTFLHQSHPKAVPRDALLDTVWGYVDTVETHTLETHIYRLRQKIEGDPSKPQILITTDDGYTLNFSGEPSKTG